MARFVSIADFQGALGAEELYQVAGTGNLNDPAARTLDTARIEEALTFAEDLLIGYARARYAEIENLTPETAPALVKGLVTDVARYRIRARSGGQGQISEIVQKRHDDALASMRAIATGKFELPIGGAPANGEVGSSRMDAVIPPGRTDRILKGWL